ncbi:MAG: class I SAM-dependent methyltransferase [Gammaproteobacteria bacterium]|nr:class I SAM-dependent methyltransferase [candidate division Zixibacteria bacterium]NIR96389.1 class I SAM-dependent methyltransferase [Gammaproteobacteria bacterium]NIT56547.1 class I SAM-dependent methyltransferase [Fodinibius sp.]NIR63590.1 class I SAM-dependent methyltransferase [candidate division Zixibacteria bacterium]NIS46627.1 class I SAM-dependent methyltransferase [candidate division Zixibacteria bacterium]
MRQKYSQEPDDLQEHQEEFDQIYSRYAKAYSIFVKVVPLWMKWITSVLPHIRGDRVLEISFGTGDLFLEYADDYQTIGLDYNSDLIHLTGAKLANHQIFVPLVQGDVAYLPFPNNWFDTVISTMAYSSYPDGEAAANEIYRIIKPGGRFLLMDVNYPKNNNLLGNLMVRFWMLVGDIVRDINSLLLKTGFAVDDREVGGFGSTHLYIAEK